MGALLVAVGTDACEGSSGGGSGSTNDDVMRFADDVAAMLCDSSMQCCGPEGFTPPADCSNTAQRQMRAVFQERLDDGLTFNPKVGADCLAAYRAAGASCPKRFDVPVCDGVFTQPPRPPEVCDAACPVSDAGPPICGTSTTVLSDGGGFLYADLQGADHGPTGRDCDTYGATPIPNGSATAQTGWCMCDPMQGSNCALGRCVISNRWERRARPTSTAARSNAFARRCARTRFARCGPPWAARASRASASKGRHARAARAPRIRSGKNIAPVTSIDLKGER